MLNSWCLLSSGLVHRLSTLCLLQVYPTGVKVVAGLEEVQDLPIQDILPSMEWRPQVVIAAACIADPYLLLHFSDGSAVLLSGDEEEGKPPIHRYHPADIGILRLSSEFLLHLFHKRLRCWSVKLN